MGWVLARGGPRVGAWQDGLGREPVLPPPPSLRSAWRLKAPQAAAEAGLGVWARRPARGGWDLGRAVPGASKDRRSAHGRFPASVGLRGFGGIAHWA